MKQQNESPGECSPASAGYVERSEPLRLRAISQRFGDHLQRVQRPPAGQVVDLVPARRARRDHRRLGLRRQRRQQRQVRRSPRSGRSAPSRSRTSRPCRSSRCRARSRPAPAPAAAPPPCRRRRPAPSDGSGRAARTCPAARCSVSSQRPACDLLAPASRRPGAAAAATRCASGAGHQFRPLVGQGQQAARLQAQDRRAVGDAPRQAAAACAWIRLAGLRQEALADHRPAAAGQAGQLDRVAGRSSTRTAARPICGSLYVVKQSSSSSTRPRRPASRSGWWRREPAAEVVGVQRRQAAAAVDAGRPSPAASAAAGAAAAS